MLAIIDHSTIGLNDFNPENSQQRTHRDKIIKPARSGDQAVRRVKVANHRPTVPL